MTPEEIESWMIPIPKGTIGLRDDRKKEKWTVDIQPFLLSKFPITQALYSSVMTENPSTFVGSHKPVETVSWYEDNSGATTQDVGLKAENSFGLFDMLGNVWEWCWDLYDPSIYGPYRVFRGGGWCDSERGCLASNRRRSHPTYKIDDLGFRVARSLERT